MAQGFSASRDLPVPISVANGGTGLTSTKAVIQRVYTQTGAMATGTTTTPIDDTIPQNTEGTEFMTLAITPKSASNILEITVKANLTTNATVAVTAALHQDSTANALAATWVDAPASARVMQATLTHTMVAGTTSATTFKVRMGGASASTISFNGSAGARIYGGVFESSIIITEYAP
jgi:hypothetical protein